MDKRETQEGTRESVGILARGRHGGPVRRPHRHRGATAAVGGTVVGVAMIASAGATRRLNAGAGGPQTRMHYRLLGSLILGRTALFLGPLAPLAYAFPLSGIRRNTGWRGRDGVEAAKQRLEYTRTVEAHGPWFESVYRGGL